MVAEGQEAAMAVGSMTANIKSRKLRGHNFNYIYEAETKLEMK